MWAKTCLILVSFCVASVPCWEEEDAIIGPTWEDFVEEVTLLSQDPYFREELEQHEAHYQAMLQEEEAARDDSFPCPYDHFATGGERPKSVDEITAHDIELVAAIGDSITAGNGINAKTLVGVRTQYRGFSWSVGGEVGYEDGSHTMPNILKHYNPDVTGYSLYNGKADEYTASRLNQAVPGSIARDLPDQAHALVELLKSKEADKVPWKVITVFVGGNDLCRYCNNPEVLSAENYAMHIKIALDILEAHLGNAFISVFGMFDVTPLGPMKKPLTCKSIDPLLCPCGTDPAEREALEQAVVNYNAEVAKMLETATHLVSRPDFTVVYQPAMTKNDIPRKPDGEADLSYMAPDCFHFSKKGHNTVARFLWNALFEPVGEKSTSMPYDGTLYCPAEGEYLRTARNSQLGWTPVPEVDGVCPKFIQLLSAWRVPLFLVLAACVASLLVGLISATVCMMMHKPRRGKTVINEDDVKPLIL